MHDIGAASSRSSEPQFLKRLESSFAEELSFVRNQSSSARGHSLVSCQCLHWSAVHSLDRWFETVASSDRTGVAQPLKRFGKTSSRSAVVFFGKCEVVLE